jgi:hypothetical protein
MTSPNPIEAPSGNILTDIVEALVFLLKHHKKGTNPNVPNEADEHIKKLSTKEKTS